MSDGGGSGAPTDRLDDADTGGGGQGTADKHRGDHDDRAPDADVEMAGSDGRVDGQGDGDGGSEPGSKGEREGSGWSDSESDKQGDGEDENDDEGGHEAIEEALGHGGGARRRRQHNGAGQDHGDDAEEVEVAGTGPPRLDGPRDGPLDERGADDDEEDQPVGSSGRRRRRRGATIDLDSGDEVVIRGNALANDPGGGALQAAPAGPARGRPDVAPAIVGNVRHPATVRAELSRADWERCFACAVSGETCVPSGRGPACYRCHRHSRLCDRNQQVPRYGGRLHAEERALAYRAAMSHWRVYGVGLKEHPNPDVHLSSLREEDFFAHDWRELVPLVRDARAQDRILRNDRAIGVGQRIAPGNTVGVLASLRVLQHELGRAAQQLADVAAAGRRAVHQAQEFSHAGALRLIEPHLATWDGLLALRVGFRNQLGRLVNRIAAEEQEANLRRRVQPPRPGRATGARLGFEIPEVPESAGTARGRRRQREEEDEGMDVDEPRGRPRPRRSNVDRGARR